MSSAALAAFLLFAAFFEIVGEKNGTSILWEMNQVVLGNPLIFVGGLIGAALVFFFASLAIRAVGTAAGEMVQEVREQFADGKIMAGEKEPEYGRCVDIATRSALKQMVVHNEFAAGLETQYKRLDDTQHRWTHSNRSGIERVD